MAKNTSQEITKRAIAVAVLKKRPQVIALFKKNGIIASSAWTDHELIVGILQAMRTNERFKTDLVELLSTVTLENKSHFTGEGMFRFTGENMFRLSGTVEPMAGKWYNADGAKFHEDGVTGHPTIFDIGPTGATPSGSLPAWATTPPPGPSPLPSNPTPAATTSGSSGGGFLSGVFNSSTISNILNQGVNVLSTSLQNKSNAQLANTALQIEQQKTQQAALAASAGAGAKPPMSTATKIGIGLLVVVGVGLLTWGVVVLARRGRARRAAA